MKLYNTLSRKSEQFKPLNDKKVTLYTCGLTVYSQPHIGNWVAYIYWDVLVRTLQASGFSVIRVQNITDVGHLTSDDDAGEDKMLKSALKEGTTAWDVAKKYMSIADHEAFDLLGLVRPNYMPRATEYIPKQIAFVQELEKKGYTYVLDDGVYFDTSRLKNYGQLARLDIEGLQFGVRVADTGKNNPTDFAVWKFSNPSEKRDMEWDSPWGIGFPGWHLECSVMAMELLGDRIDIHTGGIDHIAVHHTNEIAQTEAITGIKFANYWLHANHIKVNGTKMSKSLGNIYTLQDIVDQGYSLQSFKLLVLSKHYHTEGNFTWEILEAAQNRFNRWKTAADLIWQENSSKIIKGHIKNYAENMLTALQNNLDTPKALSLTDKAIEDIENGHFCKNCIRTVAETLNKLLGLDLLENKSDILNEQKVLISERELARKSQDWTKSDILRGTLEEQGIGINDTPQGPIWYRL